MANFLLGIDYGTGGAKACIIDTQGQVLGFAFEEYPIYTDKPGWSEHDAQRYWDAACRLIKQALLESKVAAKEIRGVAVSSALPSMVMVDENAQPVNRAYNLMDRRAIDEVQWVKEKIGEKEVLALTANRLDDHPSLINLLWETRNRPDDFKRIHKALTIDGFITLKLTGKASINLSAAAFYGVAYDILGKGFNRDLLDRIGIDPNLIPPIYRCTDIVGEVTPAAAESTGLAVGTPVAGGQVDCNAGWLGGGAVETGDIQMNLGTCGNFGVIFKDTNFMFTEIGASSINFAYTVDSENTYITVPTTTTGGQTIRYIRENYSPMEIEAERTMNVNSYDLLNLQAQKIPLGSDGLIVLPFLMGERTPIWDVYARGVVFGLSLNHTKGHLIRAAMEGVAYALYDSFQLIKNAGIPIRYPLVLNEGGAKSQLWRRIITDVFNIETVLTKRRTGAPFGDAILAGVSTGIFKDFSIAREWAEYIDPMEPIASNHDIYMQYFSVFKNIYNNVKPNFRELADLRKLSID